MADTKISALTAATTPLAGTEVLPIVQSSITKKVAVSDLTAGRSVSVGELAVDNININNNTISSTDTNGNIVLAPNGTGDVQVDADTLRVGDSNATATITTNGTGDLILNTNSGTNAGTITLGNGANNNIVLKPNGTGQTVLQADSGTDTTNLILTQSSSSGNTVQIALKPRSTMTNPSAGIQTLLASGVPGSEAGELYLRVASSGALFTGSYVSYQGWWLPGADNSYRLGTTDARWTAVYAVNGTIQTSDARAKTPVEPMTAAEIEASKQMAKEIGTFKMLDAIREKGNAARTHVGMTVQRCMEIMESHGLNPFKYGFICYDKWDADPGYTTEDGDVIKEAKEAGDRYSMRPDELLLFLARGFDARLAELEKA